MFFLINNSFDEGSKEIFDKFLLTCKAIIKFSFVYIFLFIIKNLYKINLYINSIYLNKFKNKGGTKNINKSNRIKLALCTVGKKENLYVKEFIEYYFNLGISHIFIYDDNNINDEKIADSIPGKYIQNISVYEAYKKNITHQSEAFSDCYKNNLVEFDWFIMVDMDVYLYIVDDTLENYLTNPVFEKCDFIKLNWALSTDNNQVYYNSSPLFERFKPPYIKSKFIKSIIRGNISNLKYWVHSPIYSPERNITCNCKGKKINYKKLNFESLTPINVEKAFIIHFRFKSTQELINKNKRGFGTWLDNKTLLWTLKGHIKDYFDQNEITSEKLNYIEKELQTKLYSYRITYYFNKLFFYLL